MTYPDDIVVLGHGSGGRMTTDLISDVFLEAFRHPEQDGFGDAAVLPGRVGPLAISTDGFVVKPTFFPGGDVGSLAVNGTVNDLCAQGALPEYLTASFIIEEGVPIADLRRIACSMGVAAGRAGVGLVSGDTKVVERDAGDGVYVTTAGIGWLRSIPPTGVGSIVPGDDVVVSGPIGDHGAVIAALRNGIDPGSLASDCASVVPLVDAVWAIGVVPRFMRDPTRGGFATVLAEIANEVGLGVEIVEADLPVRASVTGVCELLGLDPMYLACEGRLVLVVPEGAGKIVATALSSVPEGAGAACVGRIVNRGIAPVTLLTRFGGRHPYDILASDPLPRIC